MKSNINTKHYWEQRFKSGDWEEKGGETQTKQFAESQIKFFELSPSFAGSILDFGCGLGDSFPVYKKAFPNAQLIGFDISEEAIFKCRSKYGSIGSFASGDLEFLPNVDVIVASNVFEHLSNDLDIAKTLLKKCKILYIIVPFEEQEPLSIEHVNTYGINSFISLGRFNHRIFTCKGWSQFGFNLYYSIYFKNIFRFLMGKKLIKRAKQIIFTFENMSNVS
jgi:SAM-dependent methyltransferase